MRQEDDYRRGRHDVSALNVHLVFVTKYRAQGADRRAHGALRDVRADFGATLVEMDGEDDHVHLLVPTRHRLLSPGW